MKLTPAQNKKFQYCDGCDKSTAINMSNMCVGIVVIYRAAIYQSRRDRNFEINQRGARGAN